jgi:hypothetical protein
MDNYNNQTNEGGKNMNVENQIVIHIQMWCTQKKKKKPLQGIMSIPTHAFATCFFTWHMDKFS